MISRQHRWLLGEIDWSYHIGLSALNPLRSIRQYRSLRRNRPSIQPPYTYRTMSIRKSIAFIAFCRKQELMGWRKCKT